MNPYLLAAAAVALLTGALHSWLGERYILIRLFRQRELPPLFGSDIFTRRTLRFAWHLTTLAWWGFAALLLTVASEPTADPPVRSVLTVVRWTFLISAVYALAASRGRHLSWVLFTTIAVALWLGGG